MQLRFLTVRQLLPTVPLFAAALLAACTQSGAQVPEVRNGDAVLIEGRELYTRNCAQCHGAAGGGGRGEQLSEGAVLASFPEIDDQVAVVSGGRNNMPAFGEKFSDDQLVAVVRFTREVLSAD